MLLKKVVKGKCKIYVRKRAASMNEQCSETLAILRARDVGLRGSKGISNQMILCEVGKLCKLKLFKSVRHFILHNSLFREQLRFVRQRYNCMLRTGKIRRLINSLCPADEASDWRSLLKSAAPHQSVYSFFRAVMSEVLTDDLLGRENKQFLLKQTIREYTGLRSNGLLEIDALSESLLAKLPFYYNDCSYRDRQFVVTALLCWLFTQFIIPLSRVYFYIVDAQTDVTVLQAAKHPSAPPAPAFPVTTLCVLYYRKATWNVIQQGALESCIESGLFKQIEIDAVSSTTNVIGCLRFMPKPTLADVRPICSFGASTRELFAKFVRFVAANSARSTEAAPFDYSTCNCSAALRKLYSFTDSNAAKCLDVRDNSDALYYFKLDISKCYDNLPQVTLYKLARTILHSSFLHRRTNREANELYQSFKRLLRAAIFENYVSVTVNGTRRILHQVQGVPQGHPLSSFLCNLLLSKVDQHFLERVALYRKSIIDRNNWLCRYDVDFDVRSTDKTLSSADRRLNVWCLLQFSWIRVMDDTLFISFDADFTRCCFDIYRSALAVHKLSVNLRKTITNCAFGESSERDRREVLFYGMLLDLRSFTIRIPDCPTRLLLRAPNRCAAAVSHDQFELLRLVQKACPKGQFVKYFRHCFILDATNFDFVALTSNLRALVRVLLTRMVQLVGAAQLPRECYAQSGVLHLDIQLRLESAIRRTICDALSWAGFDECHALLDNVGKLSRSDRVVRAELVRAGAEEAVEFLRRYGHLAILRRRLEVYKYQLSEIVENYQKAPIDLSSSTDSSVST